MKRMLSLPKSSALFCLFTGLQLLLPTSSVFAQYDTWAAPRLLAEYRQMLVNMDSTIKALDRNIALAEELAEEKTALNELYAEIAELRSIQDESGAIHNAEVLRFNSQCLDSPVTTQEASQTCNTWSDTLNSKNAELTSSQDTLITIVEEYNSKVASYNNRETARAEEALELDQNYDKYEQNASLIEARLSRMDETSDIYSRCARYSEAETRQSCMQDIWNREGNSTRPYTRTQPL